MLILKHESSGAADTLLGALDAAFTQSEMLRLRFVCRIFELWVTNSNIFGVLYVSPWYTCQKDQNWPALQRIGSLCRELVVNIPTTGPPCTASTGIVFDPSPNLPTNGDWPAIFRCLRNLQTLTLHSPSSHSDPNTLSYATAGLLTHLRTSLEQHPPQTQHLRVRGLPATHTVFLRASSPCYGSAPRAPPQRPWAALTSLTLQLLPPPPAAQRDAAKALRGWLAALAPRLRALRFAWLHGGAANRGPHPLALAEALRAREARPARWAALRALWVAGVARERSVRPLVRRRAPALGACWVFCGRLAVGEGLAFDERVEAWEEVPLYGLAGLAEERRGEGDV